MFYKVWIYIVTFVVIRYGSKIFYHLFLFWCVKDFVSETLNAYNTVHVQWCVTYSIFVYNLSSIDLAAPCHVEDMFPG